MPDESYADRILTGASRIEQLEAEADRLRKRVADHDQTIKEMDDEADRLQDANDSLRTWVEMGEDEADRLRAERDRYREALREIDEAVAHGSRDVLYLKGVARAALEGS